MPRSPLNRQSVLPYCMLVVYALIETGCGPKNQPTTVSTPVAAVRQPVQDRVVASTSNDNAPVMESVVQLLSEDSKGDRVFPPGVRVNSVSLSSGVASIDFSREFATLANSGESVEAIAQHALRKTLSKYTAIDKMRVTVEGKPFDSQATDWNTPFPVRESRREMPKSSAAGQPNSTLR